MKIKYFSYIADQSFVTSPEGERLFYYLGGFWSKPYIIPDQETEKRLFKKQLWLLRIFLGSLILSPLVLFKSIDNIIPKISAPFGFVLFFLALTALFYLISWIIFRNDIGTLKRTRSSLRFVDFYRDSAKRHSIVGLILGLLGCVGFVWVGSSMITDPSSVFIGWVSIIFFGCCGILWGYTLLLKLAMLFDKEVGENKTQT